MIRYVVCCLLTVIGPVVAAAQPNGPSDASFAAFLQELWPDAQAKGVTRTTFDAAFAGVTPDPRVIAATARQPGTWPTDCADLVPLGPLSRRTIASYPSKNVSTYNADSAK